MKQLGFLIHADKCIGCYSCRFSCHNENGQGNTFRRKVHQIKNDLYEPFHSFQHISMSCNHCETPACLAVCPEGAIQKKQNGIVLIDKMKCSGCRKCETSCPFGAIQIDPISGKADKCDMCYDRLMEGKTTICISSCPVQAIEIININDAQNDIYEKEVYGFEMKKMTNPSIRFTKKEKDHFKQFWATN